MSSRYLEWNNFTFQDTQMQNADEHCAAAASVCAFTFVYLVSGRESERNVDFIFNGI